MNQQQRDKLTKLKPTIEEAKRKLLDTIKPTIEGIKSDEEGKYNNLPDGLRDGEQGEKVQEGIDLLDDALSDLEEADSYIQSVIDKIEEAVGA